MTRLPLELTFKGERNYLQGPDILCGLLGSLSNAGADVDGALAATFRRKVGAQPDVVIAGDENAAGSPENSFGHWTAVSGSRKVRGWFVETKRHVEERVPYDEVSAIGQCAKSSNEVAFDGVTTLNATELAVAMVKSLHNDRFALGADAHWVVCQFALDRPLRDEYKQGMRVVLHSTLGKRLTKSVVFSGGQMLGHLFFSPAER